MAGDLTDSAVNLINVIESPTVQQGDKFLAGWRQRTDFMRGDRDGFATGIIAAALVACGRLENLISSWDTRPRTLLAVDNHQSG